MRLLAVFGALVIASPAAAITHQGPAVWAIDLVKTKPGLQADYLEYLRLNWFVVRQEMKRSGAVRSFSILVSKPIQPEAADVFLLTEYPSRAAFEARERQYLTAVSIVRRPGEGPTLVRGRGARELSDIVGSFAPDVFLSDRR